MSRSVTLGKDEDFIFPDDLDKIKPEPFAVFVRILKDHKVELSEEKRIAIFESIKREIMKDNIIG